MRLQFRKDDVTGPTETGQTPNLTPIEVVDRYLPRRNAILVLLRAYNRKTISEVADALGISDAELERIENSDDLVPFQLAPKISTFFKIDLKQLLVLLGLANAPTIHEQSGEQRLAIAAQYSGPELTEQEKIDFQDLFKMILENVKKRRKDEPQL